MSEQTQIQLLHSQADKLGLKYHHRAGEDKLRALIGAYLVANPAKAGLLIDSGDLERAPTKTTKLKVVPDLDYKPLSATDYKKLSQKQAKMKAGSLRRIRFTNMNPAKKNWPGENISVGSARLGTFKKHLPFNGEPYHVPQIIYDMMKERMCSVFYDEAQKRGGTVRKGRLIKEFAIEDLPPLTAVERDALGSRQALAATGL